MIMTFCQNLKRLKKVVFIPKLSIPNTGKLPNDQEDAGLPDAIWFSRYLDYTILGLFGTDQYTESHNIILVCFECPSECKNINQQQGTPRIATAGKAK